MFHTCTSRVTHETSARYAEAKPHDEWDTTGNVSLMPEWANEAVFYQIFPLGYFGAPTVNNGKGPVSPRLAQIRNHYKHLSELGRGGGGGGGVGVSIPTAIPTAINPPPQLPLFYKPFATA